MLKKCLRSSSLPQKKPPKTPENQTMQKHLAQTGQMENTWGSPPGFVHQDIKADMDSDPPPPFNGQLLGPVYFSLNCLFSPSKGPGRYLAPAVQSIW